MTGRGCTVKRSSQLDEAIAKRCSYYPHAWRDFFWRNTPGFKTIYRNPPTATPILGIGFVLRSRPKCRCERIVRGNLVGVVRVILLRHSRFCRSGKDQRRGSRQGELSSAISSALHAFFL